MLRTDYVEVTVLSKPIANAGPDISICQGISVTIGNTATGGAAPITYYWTASPPPNPMATTATITVTPSVTTTYYQTATGNNGCSSTDAATVTVFKNPNHISNGGFEMTSAIPEMRGQVDKASGWFKATGDPDLFHRGTLNTFCHDIADLECVDVPENHFGNREHVGGPSEGNAYAGLWAAFGIDLSMFTTAIGTQTGDPTIDSIIDNIPEPTKILVEGITTEIAPLKPNTQYELSFYVAKGQKAETSIGDGFMAITDLIPEPFRAALNTTINTLRNQPAISLQNPAKYVVKFSGTLQDHDLTELYHLYTPIKEPVKFPGSVSSTSWTRKTHVFTTPSNASALANMKYLIIESDIDVFTLQSLCAGCSYQSYFYIDSISLREKCPYANSLAVSAGPDVSVCNGSSVTLNATASGGAPPYLAYKWTPATGLSDPTLPNPVANPTSTTTYSVKVYDSNGDSSATDAVTVTVNNHPVANAGPDQGVCGGACATLGGSPTASGGGSPYSYTWTASSGTAPTGANPSVCPTTDTQYWLTVTDANGCTGKDSAMVTTYVSSEKVSNGGFEQGIPPVKRGDIANATGWLAADGTPDLFGTDAPPCGVPCPASLITMSTYNCVGVPCNHLGIEAAHGGNRYAGLANKYDGGFADGGAQYEQEAMMIDLGTPLNVNREYILELYASRGESPDINQTGVPTGTASVVARMGTLPVVATSTTICSKPIFNSNGWTKVYCKFTPADPYQYLIIQAGNGGGQSYVYVDDVSLRDSCSGYVGSLSGGNDLHAAETLSPDLDNNSKSKAAENPTDQRGHHIATFSDSEPRMEVHPNPNSGQFTLEYTSVKQPAALEITIMNPLGQVVENFVWSDLQSGKNTREINLTYSHVNLAAGLYVIQMKNGNDVFTRRISIVR